MATDLAEVPFGFTVKNLGSTLLTFLQTNNIFGRADLFAITLVNGQVLRTTSSQADITYGGNIFYSSLYGAWQRGVLKMEASFSLAANDMPLTAMLPASILFPGTSIPMMQCLTAGLFDGAAVTVYTAYWAPGEAPNTTRGVETKFVGQILDFKQTGRSIVEFTVADLLYLLNLKTPPKLIQASCRHTLYDANCTLLASAFGVSRTVAAGSTTQTINLSSAVTAAVYAQGFITFTSGANAGITMSIKSQPSTTQIVLAGFTPLALAVGDGFTMYQGCNKTQARCSQLGNLLNNGSEPYVPNPEVAV